MSISAFCLQNDSKSLEWSFLRNHKTCDVAGNFVELVDKLIQNTIKNATRTRIDFLSDTSLLQTKIEPTLGCFFIGVSFVANGPIFHLSYCVVTITDKLSDVKDRFFHIESWRARSDFDSDL